MNKWERNIAPYLKDALVLGKFDEMHEYKTPAVKYSDEINHTIFTAKSFASFDPSGLSAASKAVKKLAEEIRRKEETMKDNILVLINDKAYKPREVSVEWHDAKSYLNPFNQYKIEVTECPSAERVWTPDKLRRVYSEPKKIIFNGPATIVFWKDGTKTVVKAANEAFDPEKGIAMAYLKKFLGNKGNYFNTIKKAIKMAECAE